MTGCIKGVAHITGGGLLENIPRVLPKGLGVRLDANSWQAPAVFRWLAKAGHVDPQEMARTFNCGIGLVTIAAPKKAERAAKIMADAGEQVFRIGVVEANTSSLRVMLQGAGKRVAVLNIAVLISGRGSNLQALIDAAQKPGYPAKIACVISNVPDAGGLARAKAANIPTQVIDNRPFKSREEFEHALDARLNEYKVQLVCLAGFMRLLTPWFVERWRDRLINIHPSLLPLYPGLDTHRRALEAGDKTAGCTVHFVRTGTDTGPTILQATVPVQPGDTPETLAARVLEAEHLTYVEAVRAIAEGRVNVLDEKVFITSAA